MKLNPMKSFIALIQFDQKSRDVSHSVSTIEQEIVGLEAEIRKIQHAVEQRKNEIAAVRKQLSEAELELKSTDLQVQERYRELEASSGDYKSLQAHKSELERLQRLQIEQERLVVELVNRIDHIQKGVEKNITDSDTEIANFQHQINTKREKIEALKRDLAGHAVERKPLEKDIPHEWLTMYDEMRLRVPDPVVPVSYDSCTGCFSLLTAANLQQVRRNSLVPCAVCHRLLYREQSE